MAAEHLRLGGAGVVEAGAVDDRDAHAGMFGGQGAEAPQVAGDVGDPAGEVVAERVGAEHRAGRVDGAVHLQQGAGRRLPVAARAQGDGGEVEQHAVEQGVQPGGVDTGLVAQVERHRRGALLQFLQRPAVAAAHQLADLPVAAAGGDRRRCLAGTYSGSIDSPS